MLVVLFLPLCKLNNCSFFQDKKADLRINAYVDEVLVQVMKKLQLEIPEYCNDIDPTKTSDNITIDWTIKKSDIEEIKNLYNLYRKNKKRTWLAPKEKESYKIRKKVEDDVAAVKPEDDTTINDTLLEASNKETLLTRDNSIT